jgi:hypothetical protein
MTDTAQGENVHRLNDTVTLVGETYCVAMRGRYVLAGLQEALGG